MITCTQLTKVFHGKNAQGFALHAVDLHVDKGEFVIIGGRLGAGKSTLLRLVCGLLRPTTGELEVDGVRLPARRRHLAALRRRMGIIEQRPRLLEAASVHDNVALGLEVLGLTGSALRQKTLQALRSTGLEAHAALSVRKLSAGQRQLVAVARALAGEPLIILADEPFGHLDAEAAAEVAGLLRWMNLQGCTVLAAVSDAWPRAGAGEAEVPARRITLERGRLRPATRDAMEARELGGEAPCPS